MYKTIAFTLLLFVSSASAFDYVTVAETVFVAGTARDYYVNSNGSVFASTAALDFIGKTTGSNNFSSGATFVSLSIPAGAIIDTVFGIINANASAGTPATLIYFEDVASGTAPTSYAEFNGKTLTTASVAWEPTGWSAGTEYKTPNLAAPMQEVVSRGDYSEGNDFTVLVLNNGSATSNNATWKDASNTTNYRGMILYVVYHVPDQVLCTDALTSPSAVAKLTGVDCRLRLTRP